MVLWHDIRFALRLLIKDRWFSAAAVTALSLGLAVNTAVFTLVNAVLVRGLPYEGADRLMALWTEDVRGGRSGVGARDRIPRRRGHARVGRRRVPGRGAHRRPGAAVRRERADVVGDVVGRARDRVARLRRRHP